MAARPKEPLSARVRETVRRAGLRALVWEALGATVYRHLIVVSRRLDLVSTEHSPSDASIEHLTPDAVDEYLAYHASADPVEIRARITAGSICTIARENGKIVASTWSSNVPQYIAWVDATIELLPHEAYRFDAFTPPSHRGRGLAVNVGVAESLMWRDKGFTHILAGVTPANHASKRMGVKIGGRRPIGWIGMIRLGPFHRTIRHLKR